MAKIDIDRIEEMSFEELKEQLITSDYNGKEFKQYCLREIIARCQGPCS